MTEIELINGLNLKLELLEQILENTDIQLRFVRRREMTGLRRLLRERDGYIRKLIDLNEKLKTNGKTIALTAAQALQAKIEDRQRAITAANATVMAAAVKERDNIAADLQRVNAQRELRTCYENRWLDVRGTGLNRQG